MNNTGNLKNHIKQYGLERFLTSRFFIILGIISLLIGFYFFIITSKGSRIHYEMMMNFPKTSNETPGVTASGKFLSNFSLGFGVLRVFILALLLVNVLGIYFVKKFFGGAWLAPLYFVCMFLCALVLPLLLHQNMILLFMAGLSVFMLLYAISYKNKIAVLISFGSIVIMMGNFFYLWINSYIPVFFNELLLPHGSLLLHGVISGVGVVVALSAIRWLLMKKDIPLTKKMFRIGSINRWIRGFLLLSLFLTAGWVLFSLICKVTGTLLNTSVGWFISGSLFFILLINYYSGKKSTFKKPILYFAFSLLLLFPFLVHWNMKISLQNIIRLGEMSVVAILLHYSALALFVVLSVMTLRRIDKYYLKNSIVQQSLSVLSVAFLFFIFCTEYTNLSVFISHLQDPSMNSYTVVHWLLTYNRYLPYSIIMWIVTVIVLTWSVFNHKSFMRSLSLVLFPIILIKIFAYDFETLTPNVRSIVFMVLGLFIISFAFLYPQLLKVTEKNNTICK